MRARMSCLVPLAPIVLVALAGFITSCSSEATSDDKIGVVVTIQPQAEFVESVGAGLVDVTIMIPPGASPHTYDPTPQQIRELAAAEMYAKVGSGVEFELAWLDKLIAQTEDMLVIDCSHGVELIEMGAANEHEAAGDLDGAMDPHIWMSPRNAATMVRNICDGLVQVDPDNRQVYEANRDAYLQTLTELDQDIAAGLSGVSNRVFMVYHPAFGYFARDYDLTMLPVEEEGKEPTAAGLAHLIDQAKTHNIQVIFASPQFNPQSANVIAEQIGGSVILIDPLATDYVANLRGLLDELALAME